ASQKTLHDSRALNEAPKLTRQELDWQQLLETLKRCTNNRANRLTLSWHPRYKENYYLAKLRVLWQQYEANYGPVVLDNFTQTVAHEVAEERRQTVVARHVEDQQNLITHAIQMGLSPTQIKNKKSKLEQQKERDLKEIYELTLQLGEHAADAISFAQQPVDQTVTQVFNDALTEIARHDRAVASNPALFKLTMGTRHRNHALATLDTIDNTQEMQYFAQLITATINSSPNTAPAA
ncbi:MAG: hypothetical protein KDH94_07830, partial [Coxiellaceae bacterium]|nr:hypothetical protein [Coxiellaceae bacterium]